MKIDIINDKLLNGLNSDIQQQEFNQVLTNINNKVSCKSKNIQQEFINKAIAERQLLEKSREIFRDIKNPLYLSFLAGFFEGEGNSTISIVVSKKKKNLSNMGLIYNPFEKLIKILVDFLF